MATQPHTTGGASALPLSLALSVIPSLPRPMLSRLVARAIDRLDEMDGDPDLEDDDPIEEDDHSGGNVDDVPHDDAGESEPDCPEARRRYARARRTEQVPVESFIWQDRIWRRVKVTNL